MQHSSLLIKTLSVLQQLQNNFVLVAASILCMYVAIGILSANIWLMYAPFVNQMKKSEPIALTVFACVERNHVNSN